MFPTQHKKEYKKRKGAGERVGRREEGGRREGRMGYHYIFRIVSTRHIASVKN